MIGQKFARNTKAIAALQTKINISDCNGAECQSDNIVSAEAANLRLPNTIQI